MNDHMERYHHDRPPPEAASHYLIDTGTMFYAEAERLNRVMPVSEEERARLVAALPPQTVENLSNELCVGAEPDQPTVTQDELLTALDELLDSALHDDACYIHENDTECVCVIGKVRAALPPCGAGSLVWGPPDQPAKAVRCHRNAHPSSPDRHVF